MDILNLMKDLSIKKDDEESGSPNFKTCCADIDGVSTEFIVAEYSTKTILIISQHEKIGSMMHIQKDQVHGPQVSSNIYSIRVIFGATSEESQVAARYLAEQIDIHNVLYLFISLKSYDIETVKACKDVILDIKKEDINV